MSPKPLRLVISPDGDTEGFRREFTERTDYMIGKPVTSAASQGAVTFYQGQIAAANVLDDGISVEIFVVGLAKLLHLHPVSEPA